MPCQGKKYGEKNESALPNLAERGGPCLPAKTFEWLVGTGFKTFLQIGKEVKKVVISIRCGLVRKKFVNNVGFEQQGGLTKSIF